MLEAKGIGDYAEPCHYWEFDQTREVTQALSLYVTGGEQNCEFAAWKTMIDTHPIAIVQPDGMFIGGMTRTLQVCRIAEATGLPVPLLAANLSPVTICTLQLLRKIPNAGKYLELRSRAPTTFPGRRGCSPAIPTGTRTVGWRSPARPAGGRICWT